MTDNEIIKALDGADLFLRNRTTSKPAPLNQYDINELLDIAKVCDEAANLINRQKAEIERLQAMVEREREKYEITLDKLKETLEERADHTEAIKEFAERLKKFTKNDLMIKAFLDKVIDNLVKEIINKNIRRKVYAKKKT